MRRLSRAGIYFILASLIVKVMHAQPTDLGKVLSYARTSTGIKGRTAVAQFEVIVYNNHIIRLRITRNNSFNTINYALADDKMPGFQDFQVNESNNQIVISTKSMSLELERAPNLRASFKNAAGQLVNEDVKNSGFGVSYTGERVSIYKKLQEGERFVGMGEALGNLDKRGMGITLNNFDNYHYGDPRLPMYVSIPFYMGIHHNMVYGIFFNNTYKSFFNFGMSTPDCMSANFEGGDCDYFFFYDESMGKILEDYTSITGRIALPPIWSLGYHQSRASYYPQDKVQWIAETFRFKKIPLDCIVLDADYLVEYEPFRINKNRFPDMPGLAAQMKKLNIELTASVNPGIKIDSTYEANQDGLQKDVFVKYSDGHLLVSDIFPSRNHFVDFTNPKGRNWWIDKMKFLPDNGIHGYWNDMNEPAVNGSYLPDNVMFDFDGRKAYAPEAKNVYGFQMARSSYESAIKYGEGRRPFILTRSGFSGVQRYSAVWSGDNTAKDEGLLSSVLLNSQLGLSGIAFCGYDIGGYIGDASKDLFKRWMQVGMFSPFCRNHREFFSVAGEPWAYGEEVEAISKSYIGFRYRLMPYIYSKFYEASTTGMPVARSLCVNDPFDARVYGNSYQYEFLFGDSFWKIYFFGFFRAYQWNDQERVTK